MNGALSIALPTYNRAAILDVALKRLIATVAPYDIAILVSDNASDDDTTRIVEKHAASYPWLRYTRAVENMGPDANFESVLRRAESRYVWLLGDTYEIELDTLRRVLEIAESEQGFDAIVVDVEGRATHIPTNTYTDRDDLLLELGWHLTCMSALVLSRDLATNGSYFRYQNTSFIHVGVLLEYIAFKRPKVQWLSGGGVRSLHIAGLTKTSVWEPYIFDVWIDRWIGFVFSLPPTYTLDSKLICALSHAQLTGLFSFRRLIKLRAAGLLTVGIVRRRWHSLRLAVGRRRFGLLAVAMVPTQLTRLAVQLWSVRS